MAKQETYLGGTIDPNSGSNSNNAASSYTEKELIQKETLESMERHLSDIKNLMVFFAVFLVLQIIITFYILSELKIL